MHIKCLQPAVPFQRASPDVLAACAGATCAGGQGLLEALAPRDHERSSRCSRVCCCQHHVRPSGEHTGGDHHARLQAWDELLHLSELAAQSHAASAPADPVGGAPPPAAAAAPPAHPLAGVPDAVERDGAAWQAFCALEAPEGAALLGGLASALTPIEQLLARPSCGRPFAVCRCQIVHGAGAGACGRCETALRGMRPASRSDRGPRMQVLRCLRPDRATVAMTRYVAVTLGPSFVQPPVLEYADVLRQSDERTPIVFVLSPGADPAFDIFKLGALPARERVHGVCRASTAGESADALV
jgi:hypothetical protein